MGRTGEAQNNQANNQYMAAQTDQIARSNAQMDKFNADLGTLKSGKDIGANPFATTQYLQNENRDAATAAGATADSARAALTDNALRTGDNSASTAYAIKNNARAGQQQANNALIGQHSQDYLNNLNWQQGLLGNDMGTVSASNNLYGTATTGRNDALNNLTQFGLASYGPMNSLIGAAGAGIGGYFTGRGK